MGRKKKQQQKPKETTLNYNGEISVSLVRDNKFISTKKFHNNGTINLFKFLSHCLSGRYNIAESLRPKFIKMYSLGNSGDTEYIPENPLSYAVQSNETSTSFVMFKETPTTKEEDGVITTQFAFMIPFTQIDMNRDTNMLVLYSQSNYTTELAYFVVVLDKDHKDKLGKLFDRNEIININEYNLYITWGMKINNPTN